MAIFNSYVELPEGKYSWFSHQILAKHQSTKLIQSRWTRVNEQQGRAWAVFTYCLLFVLFCFFLVVIISNSGVLLCMHMRIYIYILLIMSCYHQMDSVYDCTSTCTSFDMSKFKGLAMLLWHPGFQEKVQGISRIMYIHPKPNKSNRGDSGMALWLVSLSF